MLLGMGSLDILSVDVVIEDDGEFVGFEDPSTGRSVYLGRFTQTGPGLRKLRITVVPGKLTQVEDLTEKFVVKEETPVEPPKEVPVPPAPKPIENIKR